MPTFGSLFSGIGGLDLGLERAGMKVIWQVENDPYASAVLKRHWPDVPNLGDVTNVDWNKVERPDLVCGGFPCQPVSSAGKRLGTADPRWLWPEFARCLRVLRPNHVLVENVPGLLVRGRGMESVLGELVSFGYDAEWDCLPAAAFGAPHLRYRVFLVAYPAGVRRHRPVLDEPQRQHKEVGRGELALRDGADGIVADVDKREFQVIAQHNRQPQEDSTDRSSHRDNVDRFHNNVPHPESQQDRRIFERGIQPYIRANSWWATEPDVGRVAHGIPHRVDRLRCLGNAVVPQVAEWVGRRLMEAWAA